MDLSSAMTDSREKYRCEDPCDFFVDVVELWLFYVELVDA